MLPRATYAPDETVYGEFNTFDAVTVELITLAGTPSLRLNRIRAGVRTEITGAGITLRVDEDDTGRHEYDIDLDDANITAAAGDEYTVAFNAGTVDGVPVEGVAIDRFAVQADGLTTQQKADVNAEADTALTDYGAAVPGSEMALEDDAITAGKYDQTTAFPMADADGTALTEAGGTGDQLTAVSLTGLDEAALQQIVDDLEDGGRLDLLIDAIKAKTDDLTFTVANELDANVQSINDAALTGDGTVGTEWGPA
jgi:hypothetical protein